MGYGFKNLVKEMSAGAMYALVAVGRLAWTKEGYEI